MNSSQEKISFSPVIIGTMRLGEWGVKMTSSELERFIDECVELGMVDFDHADIYGCYTSERAFGEVLKRRTDLRSKLQITTKCGIKLICESRPSHKIKSYDSSAKHIIWSAENSLKELGVDSLDLMLLHRPDYLMNPHEIAEAFEKLKKEGKVKFFGVSNFTTDQFEMLNSFTPLVNNQIEVSILHRNAFEDGTLEQCLKLGIQPTAWSPLGGGEIFSKKEESIESNLRDLQIFRIQKMVQELVEKHSATPDQILLAFLRKHPAGIVPVLGTSKINRVKSAIESLKINLTHEEWYELWEAATGSEVA